MRWWRNSVMPQGVSNWSWGRLPLDVWAFEGVPLRNFLAWFLVCHSATLLLRRTRLRHLRRYNEAVAMRACNLVFYAAHPTHPPVIRSLALAQLLLTGLLVVFRARRGRR